QDHVVQRAPISRTIRDRLCTKFVPVEWQHHFSTNPELSSLREPNQICTASRGTHKCCHAVLQQELLHFQAHPPDIPQWEPFFLIIITVYPPPSQRQYHPHRRQ